jgi:hypothetical protein
MKVASLNREDESAFNKLALEYGTVFNSCEWINLFGNNVKRHGIYNKGGELIGGFITYRENKYGLSIYRNPPYTPEIGPFLKIDASNPVSIMDTWKETLTLSCDFIDKLQYSIISFSLNKNIIDMQPFIWNKFKVVPGYTYILDLAMSSDDIWKKMSNERRKNINKGTKDGLNAKRSHDMKIIHELVLKTYKRQKKDIDMYYLNKILFEFANEDNSFAYATYQNEEPVACSMCIYDKRTAYYILGGYDFQNKHHGAGAMSMWESIQHAKDMGLKYFDFEGSMNPQIERYLRGFGGQLTPYYRINKASFLLEVILKVYRRDLF